MLLAVESRLVGILCMYLGSFGCFGSECFLGGRELFNHYGLCRTHNDHFNPLTMWIIDLPSIKARLSCYFPQEPHPTIKIKCV
ncbi:hypothetical protein F4811DRAFT_538747 [Daldinia bambusicola]|nr:hypothetical protein F4811DRAFT_538747 [Daldinia bambusicola]